MTRPIDADKLIAALKREAKAHRDEADRLRRASHGAAEVTWKLYHYAAKEREASEFATNTAIAIVERLAKEKKR